MVAEVDVPQSQEKVVIKLWKKPGLSGFLRRISRTGNVYLEWNVMNLLHDSEVRVPCPLGLFQLPSAPGGYTDAVVMSYFEKSERGIERLRILAEQKDDAKRLAFEESVIELTEAVLKAGVLDVDHHLVNILALPSNKAARVDFEIAKFRRKPQNSPKLYGEMLGALFSTYLFGIQPHVSFADRFSESMIDRLKPPRQSLVLAKQMIQKRIEVQRQTKGIDTPWDPSW